MSLLQAIEKAGQYGMCFACSWRPLTDGKFLLQRVAQGKDSTDDIFLLLLYMLYPSEMAQDLVSCAPVLGSAMVLGCVRGE